MSAVNLIYLVDASGQQWLVTCDDNGQLSTVQVTGQVAVASLLVLDSVTAQVWQLTVVPNPPPGGYSWGDLRVDVVALVTTVTGLLVASPSGILFNLVVVSGAIQTVLAAAPVASGAATGPFNVLNFTASATYVGGVSGVQLPCAPGDSVTLTATIRWLAGAARPTIGLWFFDATLTNSFGAIEICSPNTDRGWHIGTVTVDAPVGAAVMVLATICKDLLASGKSYFVGFSPNASGPFGPAGNLSTPATWEVSDYRITQNGRALYAPLDTFNPNTVIGALNGVTALTVGSGYQVDDAITLLQAGASGGTVVVGGINAGGAIAFIEGGNSGKGYSVAASVPSTSPHGSGVDFQIVAVQNVAIPAATVVRIKEFVFPLYYLSLLTSQYQQAPNFYAWMAALIGPVVDLLALEQEAYLAFDIDLAVGAQLDVLGQIVGASRILPFQPTSTNFIVGSQGAFGSLPWMDGNFTIRDGSLADPMGGNTASSLVGKTTDSFINQLVISPSVASQAVAFSVYLRVPSGTRMVNIYILNQVSVTRVGVTANLTTAWQRFSATVTMAATDTAANIQIGGGGTVGIGAEIDVWGAQFEFGGSTTPYVNSTITPVLSDMDFRILLLAKIAQNQWDGSSQALYDLRRLIFPDGRLSIIDNQNMSLTLILAGVFSSLQKDMIRNGLIFPRPEGVLINYTFANLPLFGFDLNNATIAGFDLGHFA